MTRKVRAGVLAALLGGVVPMASGCGGDVSTGPDDILTEAELQLAVSAIFNRSVVWAQRVLPPRIPAEAVSGPLAALDAPPAGLDAATADLGTPMAALIPVSADTVDPGVPCALSGTVEVLAEYDGSVDDANGNYDVRYRVEQDHQSCVEGAGGEGTTIELDGRPGVIANFEAFTLDDGEEGVSGDLRGTLGISTSGGAVDCTLELDFTGAGSEGQLVYSFLGRLCGSSFQATFQAGGT